MSLDSMFDPFSRLQHQMMEEGFDLLSLQEAGEAVAALKTTIGL